MTIMDYLTMHRKLQHSYETKCCPVIKKYGINQSDFDVMMFLGNNPEHNTAKDICQIRDIKSGIVSVTVERLCQMGMLERLPDASDRRIQRLVLTQKTHDIVQDGRKIQKNYVKELFRDIDPDKLKIYQEIVQQITHNAERIEEKE